MITIAAIQKTKKNPIIAKHRRRIRLAAALLCRQNQTDVENNVSRNYDYQDRNQVNQRSYHAITERVEAFKEDAEFN